ncbi:Pre-mRNA-splicing factor cwf20 [Neolecta irregularis DAH-3]|uniref:Pre-mRNA-splicing factor cwf20 n=1 Tax=Neolecta irregularis (strain DAH-3) TaxID=1198029 RepID=A0A1U7LUS9_NEOID|nr:Pre-mRNA-splicing factor cwf20 [Neolecta irregularis DAH-3]|eukprot:OLL26430.1 Pre-mRNA-splicing factor cwf20 [Neolecta irregularis DAH-3]
MLVDYASSSESDSDPQKRYEIGKQSLKTILPPPKKSRKTAVGTKRIIIDLPATPLPNTLEEPPAKRIRTGGKGSGLSALLPAPKRSGLAKPDAASDKLDEPPLTTISFVPHSVKRKAANSSTQKPCKTAVELFPMGDSLIHRPKINSSIPSAYKPLPDLKPKLPSQKRHASPSPDPVEPHPQIQEVRANEPLSEEALQFMHGRRQPSKPADILTYNLAETYQSNEEYRTTAEETPQPVRAIGSGRHQITQLLHAVQNQKESFEEQFARNRRAKKEAGKKYGF